MNSYIYSLGLGGVAILAIIWKAAQPKALDAIPTMGSSSSLLSYFSAFRYMVRADGVIRDGYAKYKDRAFKVPTLTGWDVILCGPQLTEELANLPGDVMSFDDAVEEMLQIPYTLGPEIGTNPYHIPIIRSQLTRSLPALLPDVQDEVAAAFGDIVKVDNYEWITLPVMDTVIDCVCRISNRAFVGLPLCRDQEWLKLNKNFAMNVVTFSIFLRAFPPILRPIVGAVRYLSGAYRSLARGTQMLSPSIALRRSEAMGHDEKEWADKPNDMLQWLMDSATAGPEQSDRYLTRRIFVINFAAIHTSSMSFSQAMLHLAANPQYLQSLRAEVDAVIAEHGWTKDALRKMRKVDSFLKESQRVNGLGMVSMTRKARKDYTFSDGTFVPEGTTVSVASNPLHYDTAYYPNADVFEGYRFSDKRDDGGEGLRHQFVSTNKEYTAFGHGRFACPGRFFAAQELTIMLAHVVMTYDVKLAKEGSRPENQWIGSSCIPPNADIMFRKRQE